MRVEGRRRDWKSEVRKKGGRKGGMKGGTDRG